MNVPKRLIKTLHIPTFILWSGSVFISSTSHPEMAELWCRIWTYISLFTLCVYFCSSIFKERNWNTETARIFKSFFCIGILEMAYALLQFLGVFPSANRHFLLTGTFDNPAVLAMLISLCFPIGCHFTVNSTARHKLIWKGLTVSMGVCLILTGSRTGILSGICSFALICRPAIKQHLQKLSRTNIVILLFTTLLLLTGLYFHKQDSVNGRILIWRIAMEMIADRPMWGWGREGFDAFYMPYQADYFLHHPASQHILLADNLTNPFNEFLLFAIRYGLIGLAALLLSLVFLLRSILKQKSDFRGMLIGIFTTLFLWSMFSYPFRIPFVWLTTVSFISIILFPNLSSHKYAKPLSTFILLCCFPPIIHILHFHYNKIEWVKVQERSSDVETTDLFTQYALLYERLKGDGDFLYNYGAELHYAGQYKKSLDILKECTTLYNDYNVQMLMADNYQQLGFTDKAILRYKYANLMVPNRFLPLYYEMQVHIKERDSIQACKVARTIINKPVKNQKSRTVKKIISEAEKYLHDHTF